MISVKKVGEALLSKTAYPRPAVAIANKWFGQNLEIHKTAKTSRNCQLRWDITLGPEVYISRRCKLHGNINIRKRTNLNRNVGIHGEVDIGKYCAFAPNALIRTANHDTRKPAIQTRFYNDFFNTQYETQTEGPVTIGNDVWIGDRAIILSGVTIGDGAVIGAGSIVTHDVDPYSIVAGVPATHIRWRFPSEIREKLLEFSWWDLSDHELREHEDFFKKEITGPEDIPGV